MSISHRQWLFLGLFGVMLWPLWQLAWRHGAVAGQTREPVPPIVAIVDGKEFTEQDLLERVRGELLRLENQLYEVKRKGVEDLIAAHLLEQAAKARSLTAEQLLHQEADSTVGEVTPKEVEAFYAANQARIKKPLEEVRGQIHQYLQQSKLDEARRVYLKGLREKTQVKVYLRPPIVEVSAAEAPFKGPKDAPITIVEFSDFQCPFCKRILPVLAQLLEQYAGQVKLAFRDFPLVSIHAQAQQAAEAAHCAGDQGKFWEYHDLLFAKQEALPTANFAAYAKTLGLDSKAFQACLDSRKFKAKVERDNADGVKAGVSGTPAFFINGRLLSGAQPLEAFKAVIDEELERLGLRVQR